MLKIPFAWAKLPLIDRFGDLDDDLHVSFIYGQDTWMDADAGEAIQQYVSLLYHDYCSGFHSVLVLIPFSLTLRQYKGRKTIDLHFIKNAGHHVMLDNPQDFNARMEEIGRTFTALRQVERQILQSAKANTQNK